MLSVVSTNILPWYFQSHLQHTPPFFTPSPVLITPQLNPVQIPFTLLRMRILPGSLQHRRNQSLPTPFPGQPINQTKPADAILEISIDGLSDNETIDLTITGIGGSGSRIGAFSVNQSSTMTTFASGLPLMQTPPFHNGSAASASTPYITTGFGTNPIQSLPPMPTNATAISSSTDAPGPQASGQPDGSLSLLLVIFRAMFGVN
jgi:hypothetical protein